MNDLGIQNGFFLIVPPRYFEVYIHDYRLFPINLSIPKTIPLGHMSLDLRNSSRRINIIRMDKIEISRLEGYNQCSKDKDYSFRKCWEEKVLEVAGCTHPWKPKVKGYPVCNDTSGFWNEMNFFYNYTFESATNMVNVLGKVVSRILKDILKPYGKLA